MILGHVRDNFPRVRLILPGRNGPVNVEFVVDTGFDGELSVPGNVLHELEVVFTATRSILLADSSERDTQHF